MKAVKIYQCHDIFFKELLGLKTKEGKNRFFEFFIKLFIPQPILDALDLSTLEERNIELVDQNLTNLRADSLIACHAKNLPKGDEPIIFLIEHRSTPLKSMADELFAKDMILANNLRSRAEKAKNQKKNMDVSLPLFYNIVFYCGAKPWKGLRPISGYQERINLFFNRIYDTVNTELVNLSTLDYAYLSDSIKDKYYDGRIVKDEPIFRAGLIAMKAASCNLIVENFQV
jgi:hypothetical protein